MRWSKGEALHTMPVVNEIVLALRTSPCLLFKDQGSIP